MLTGPSISLPAERGEVVANCDHLRGLKFSPTMPFAFTEHGALMAASVLNTPRAVEVSLYVVRASDQHLNLTTKCDTPAFLVKSLGVRVAEKPGKRASATQ